MDLRHRFEVPIFSNRLMAIGWICKPCTWYRIEIFYLNAVLIVYNVGLDFFSPEWLPRECHKNYISSGRSGEWKAANIAYVAKCFMRRATKYEFWIEIIETYIYHFQWILQYIQNYMFTFRSILFRYLCDASFDLWTTNRYALNDGGQFIYKCNPYHFVAQTVQQHKNYTFELHHYLFVSII